MISAGPLTFRSAVRYTMGLVLSFAVAAPFASFLVAPLFDPNTAKLTVENQAGQAVESVRVTFGFKDFQLNRIEPGASSSITLPIKSDSHFELEVKLADGRNLFLRFGYYDASSNFTDRVVVRTDEIKVEDSVIEADPMFGPKFFATFAIYLCCGFAVFFTGRRFLRRMLS